MIRLAIIGTGSMALAHALGFKSIEGVQVVAACDIDEAGLTAFADEHDIPKRFTDVDALLADDTIDAVANVTPDSLHLPIGLKVLAAGKHLFSEKPLAENYQDAKQLVDAAEATNRINMVNFTLRHAAGFQEVLKLAHSGALGRINQVDAAYYQSWLTSSYWGDFRKEPRMLWRLSSAHGSKGTLGDIGVHVFDFATAPVGPIAELTCSMKVFEHKGEGVGDYRFDVNDVVHTLVRYENGAVGTVSCSRMATGYKNTAELRIMGDEGALRLRFDQLNGDNHAYEIARDPDKLGHQWERIELAPTPTNYQRFITSIQSGINDQPTFARAAEIQKILDACFVSSDERRWISP